MLYSAYVWGAEAIDKSQVTETELGVVLKTLEIQKDQERLMELNRDLVAERYANDAEKQFIINEIQRLQAKSLCDTQNICPVDPGN